MNSTCIKPKVPDRPIYNSFQASISKDFRSNSRVKYQKVPNDATDEENSIDSHHSDSSSEDEANESKMFKEYKRAIYPWDSRRFEKHPWSNKKQPWTKMHHMRQLKLTEDEKNGILSERMVACCLTHLQRSPYDLKYALCNCRLNEKNLVDISLLRRYHYIQYLDVSSNKLTTLAALNEMPYLQYLDASYNQLEVLLDFKAPFFLSYVNYSHNKLEEIPDLSKFWSIYHLDLSYNEITKIHGLADLRYLAYLNLSFNRICTVENLDNLRIDTLIINNNQLSFLHENAFESLNYIRIVDFSNNLLKTLDFLQNSQSIEILNMENNQIRDLLDIYYLRYNVHLKSLNLLKNGVSKINHFTKACLRVLKHLNVLNGKDITSEDRVNAIKNQDINLSIASFISKMELMLLENINIPIVGSHVQRIDQPNYKVLMIVGPASCRDRYMVHRLIEECQDELVLGMIHTTVPWAKGLTYGKDSYYFEHNEFVELMRKGEFIAVSEFSGYLMGISHREMRKANGALIVFFSEIRMALTMRMTSLNVTLVLALPQSEETHMHWLKDHYFYSGNNLNDLSGLRMRHSADSCYSLFHKDTEIEVPFMLDEKVFGENLLARLQNEFSSIEYMFKSKDKPKDNVNKHYSTNSEIKTVSFEYVNLVKGMVSTKFIPNSGESIPISKTTCNELCCDRNVRSKNDGCDDVTKITSSCICNNGRIIGSSKESSDILRTKNIQSSIFKVCENLKHTPVDESLKVPNYPYDNTEIEDCRCSQHQITNEINKQQQSRYRVKINNDKSATPNKKLDDLNDDSKESCRQTKRNIRVCQCRKCFIDGSKSNRDCFQEKNLFDESSFASTGRDGKAVFKDDVQRVQEREKYTKDRDDFQSKTEKFYDSKYNYNKDILYDDSFKYFTPSDRDPLFIKEDDTADSIWNHINTESSIDECITLTNNSIGSEDSFIWAVLNDSSPGKNTSFSMYNLFNEIQEHFGKIPLLSVLSSEELQPGKTRYSTFIESLYQIINETLEPFLNAVIQQRRQLLDLHWEDPGLFNSLIFTDNEEQSLNILKEIVKNIIDDSSNDENSKNDEVSLQKNAVFNEIVLKRMEIIKATL